MDEKLSRLRQMIRRSRELARQSKNLRLRSEEVMAETDTLLQKVLHEQSKSSLKKSESK